MQGFLEFSELDEAAKTPAQKMDFKRMMAGAMSRKEYNAKYPKKVDPTKKLDKTGIYKNLIKTANEEVELEESIEIGSEKHTAVYHGGSDVIAKHLHVKHGGKDITNKDINTDYKQSKQPWANRIMFGPDHKKIHASYKALQRSSVKKEVDLEEEKKITIKTKMGGEIPGTIKVTGKDYHIVKSDVGGKQYKTDHQGNALTEAEDDKDLPFTPDAKKTKPSTPGKYGDAYSTVRNLARKALEKQKQVKEESEELDERNKENAIKRKVMDASRGAQYKIRTGLNVDPESTGHKTAQQFNKALGRALRREEIESEIEELQFQLEEGYRGNSEADKPFFDAQDHKKAAEKARKSGDYFSYHKHMVSHHDAMAHWSNNKGRHHVADQHMNKAAQHEHDAQAKAEAFYKKKGYKVHGSEYHSKQPATSMKTEEADLTEWVVKHDGVPADHPDADAKRLFHGKKDVINHLTKYKDSAETRAKLLKDKGFKNVRIEEGYRGNSKADEPFFAAQDHKKEAVKAGNKNDNFSYHMHMAAHHDAMAQWSSNKGRHHVADQHMNKAAQHEHDAQQYRKGAK